MRCYLINSTEHYNRNCDESFQKGLSDFSPKFTLLQVTGKNINIFEKKSLEFKNLPASQKGTA